MKLELILDKLNSFEKNSFLKIIIDIVESKPKNIKEVNEILLLTDMNRDLKNMDNIKVAKVFSLIQGEFAEYIRDNFVNTTSQLDILADIITLDGNCIMKQDWFSRLYSTEIENIKKKIKSFENDKTDIDDQRRRDYKIYKGCLQTAYLNDIKHNGQEKITADEQSILLRLSTELELSQEEVKLINYMIVPIEKLSIDTVINDLKNAGVLFCSKKNNTVYIADEVVRALRTIRGKQVADKFFRRVLRLLREPQINLICKKHNIDWRRDFNDKIKEIISKGISFSGVLSNDIFKEDTKITEKKKTINELCDKGLCISPALKGATIEDKVRSLVKFFEKVEQEEKIGISVNGYEKLLLDMGNVLSKLNAQVKDEFDLQDEDVLKSNLLIDYNIKPRDVLDIISTEDLDKFCKAREIKTRGNLVSNILDTYKDSENLYLENYEKIGFRDLASLKTNGIGIKESELGLKFEDLTKTIFMKLGFNVDEDVRKKLNTKKDKIDIILRLENNDLIIIECKTIKESGYSKFSSVYRQLKAYTALAESKNFKVIKLLLVAPEFSDDFVESCGDELELNLSLITASALIRILNGFKNSKRKEFPYTLFMRDVQIQDDRILKAIIK